MTQKFEPEKYHDEYRKRLEEAIEQKIAGNKISKPKEKTSKKATNLIDALKLSLEEVSPKRKTSKTKPSPKTPKAK